MEQPRISIVIPIHDMQNGDYFLWRTTQALMNQTFKDFEIVIVQEGKMAANTNAGMQKAKGELIKILYLDDYLAHENALQIISDSFADTTQWLATGCLHQSTEQDFYEDPHSPHLPEYTKDIHMGNNRIGSPSVITVRNQGHMLFDERLSFLLDCDLYRRYHDAYGAPKLIDDLNVVIGIHPGQTSNIMSDRAKLSEFEYMAQKYA